MTTKSRVKKAEKMAGAGEEYGPFNIMWSDEEPHIYEGREISEDEFNQLVKEKKIILIEWPEGDKD
jgi:hypothetical protein